MTLASIHKTAATSPLLPPPAEDHGIAGGRRALKPAELLEVSPYARGMFAHIAKPFIIPPTDEPLEELRLVFDAEGDGLLETITKFHCLVISAVDSDRVYEYGPGQIAEALEHLSRADMLIGHNIQGFDLPALLTLYDWAPLPECRIIDTLIAGRLILPNLDRLDGEVVQRTKDAAFGKVFGKYSLEAWGVRLGLTKIGAELKNWTEWTLEIQARCAGDVAINKALWRFLRPDGYPQAALELEHAVAAICDRIVSDGVPFDVGAAEQLRTDWETKRAALAAPLREQFSAVKNINSRPQLGGLLESRGWVPAKRTPKTKKPVIDDELLESLPATYPEFAGLAEYFVIGRRLGQLATGKQAWIDAVGPDGRIHGGLVHIGTPHSRAKHLGPNLAQVPNHKRGGIFAVECRRLFRHPGDWVFVTCDQGNLQDRGFAHYLAAFDGGTYARTFSEGVDQHWITALALELVVRGTTRDKTNEAHNAIREKGGKRFRYAFLFGAGGLKLGQIVADTVRAVFAIDADAGSALGAKFWTEKHPGEDVLKRTGKRVLDRFVNATPGLRQLRASLIREHRKHGWLEGLDGRRVPTEADYKALNRIVTSSEAIICKRWLVDVYGELRARFRYGPNGDAYLALWIHDELAVCCRPTIAEQVGEILVRRARKAGEPYGFRLPLEAEFKIGRDWAGTPLED
jgi:DNA polymerase I-like protein with 3'-5' exonuclease and polymerase domains